MLLSTLAGTGTGTMEMERTGMGMGVCMNKDWCILSCVRVIAVDLAVRVGIMLLIW
jgi:hypothetical protein